VLSAPAGSGKTFLLRSWIAEAGLTGGSGGERVLQDLEAAGAFVVALDVRRSWFRYHRLFADLLQLELRRAEPGLFRALHGAAAGWFAGHGHPVEAIRHAQPAHDWDLARFPAGLAANPELAALYACDELSHLHAKLGTHRRAEAVDRARALGLLTHTLTVDHRLVASRRPRRLPQLAS